MGRSKLVRDKIPAIIEQNDGQAPRTRVLGDVEFDQCLRRKAAEEGAELAEATTPEEVIGELADLFEVVDALLKHRGLTREQVQAAQLQKREARGGFERRIFLLGE